MEIVNNCLIYTWEDISNNEKKITSISYRNTEFNIGNTL